MLRAQNMDRQFDDDLGMFVNYSVRERERERERILIHASGARLWAYAAEVP